MTATNGLAATPPMGWNSWDCFGPSVREEEVKANADYMAAHLLQHGWDTVVVDIQWYEPAARSHGYRPNADLVMDEYGRLLPALNRFPSAANGAGFKPLADYVHRLGLKFGIHILRGIPRQAVRLNLPILNSPYHAADIANTASISSWIDDMYGVDMSKAGAQAYYDSILELYASWDVDFIKCDDILYPYHATEIEGISNAVQHVNRPIVLSFSPGVEMTTDHYTPSNKTANSFASQPIFGIAGSTSKISLRTAPNGQRSLAPTAGQMPTCCRSDTSVSVPNAVMIANRSSPATNKSRS